MQKIHSEIRRVDAGILAAVRQQVFNIRNIHLFNICSSLFIYFFIFIKVKPFTRQTAKDTTTKACKPVKTHEHATRQRLASS